jgi:predicted nucleic acid-binding protein
VAVVVDASVLLAVTLADPRRPRAEAALRGWLDAGEPLHAPALLPYEVASGLTRAAAQGGVSVDRLGDIWRTISQIPLTLHPLADRVPDLVAIARLLRRQSAYDAAYLDLAVQLHAELWTFDASLVRNAGALGYPAQLVE